MSAKTKPIGAVPAETAAERITRLRAEHEDVQRRIAEMREARGRGEVVDPLEITAMREEAEALADRISAAERAHALADAAETARREAEAVRARLSSVDATLTETERLCGEVHASAESLASAMDRLHQHARAVSATEPALGAKWINGVMGRAGMAVTGCWPTRLAIPSQRPIPARTPERRAAWPRQERETLALLLGPLPADPDAAPAPDAAA